jgi:UDP-N-acetylglucosamine--dolichyl-phosphate N-acetylglucosaminephosphotransferase
MRYSGILEYLGLGDLLTEFPYFTLVAAFLLSFLITIVGMGKAIKHLKNLGEVAHDKYKRGEPLIPIKGGIATLMASLFSLCVIALFSKFSLINFVIMCIVLAYALFGILDDYIHIQNRWWNIFIPFFFTFPLIVIVDLDIAKYPYLEWLNPELVFLIIVPIYVLVVSNLINMHSGFNGLQSGLSSIIFIFLFLKIFLSDTDLTYMVAPACVAASNIGFWFYNRYPAKILEGNIGSMVNGSAIGIMIVISGFLLAGFVMLIPHTVNFLMYLYWKLMRFRELIKYGPDNINSLYRNHKFGRLRKDGTIEVPNPFTLKWFLPYHFHMTEKNATRVMYGLTALFCAIGLFIPR